MKKYLGSKNAVLILGGCSILVMIYLIASLGGLELKPAHPFAYVQERKSLTPGELPSWDGIGFVIIFFAALLIILFFLLPPEQRRKILWALVQLALVGFIIFLILSNFNLGKEVDPQQEDPAGVLVTQVPGPTDTPEPQITPAVFTPPQVSSWTTYLVALMILLSVAGVWAWMGWRRRKMGAPLDALAEIARSALVDIEGGRDWGDTILNSWYRMNTAVADWRGIRRQGSMTPAEFADFLVSTHLPPQAVLGLTVLFERVRYGDKRSTRQEIQEAVDCLTAILEYCQRAI